MPAILQAARGLNYETCREDFAMKFWGNATAIIILVVGAIWTLQGANVIGGSFMSGRLLWLYIGIAMLLAGSGGLWWINVRGGGAP